MICPACGYENLSGADECDECSTPLSQLGGIPNPTGGVQRELMENAIRDVEVRDPIVVSKNASAKEVITQMREKRIGCALIVEGKELIGIFTERDILQRLTEPGIKLSEIDIQNVMTAAPEVLRESDSIAYALNKMAMGNFRHVPFQRKNGGFAVLSVRDILHAFF